MRQKRGNSKKEDLLDTVVALRKPLKYDPKEGARFEVHFEKARGFHGDDAKAFEVSMLSNNGKITWQVKEIENVLVGQAKALQPQGYTQRDIAMELNISASTVNRLLKAATGETQQ